MLKEIPKTDHGLETTGELRKKAEVGLDRRCALGLSQRELAYRVNGKLHFYIVIGGGRTCPRRSIGRLGRSFRLTRESLQLN